MKMNGFFQNAYITRDLDKWCENFKKHHGVDDFLVLELSNDVVTKWGNGPQYARVALGWVDQLQIEIIEPNGGMIDIYKNVLPDDDKIAFHHVGMRVHDWDKFRAEVDANGWEVASEGAVPGCNYIYIDARETCGHYVEYLWMTDEMWQATGGR